MKAMIERTRGLARLFHRGATGLVRRMSVATLLIVTLTAYGLVCGVSLLIL